MILYAYRSKHGIHSDTTFLTILKPVLQKNGRFYNASSWVTPVQIAHEYLRIEKGECKPFTIQHIQKLITDSGKLSPEIEELESFMENSTKQVQLAVDSTGINYPTQCKI